MTEHQREKHGCDGSPYRSYLLRVWEDAPHGGHRVVLQDVLESQARCFSSLESLFDFLRASPGRSHDGEDRDPTELRADGPLRA